MATQQEIDSYYSRCLIIVAALIVGQLTFAGVAWFLHANGTFTPSGQPMLNPITYAWILFGIAGFGAALFFRQRLVALGVSAKGQQLIRSGSFTPAHMQSQIIVMFALVEGAGLLGIVNYLLHGYRVMLVAVLVYIILASAVLFPRREWFDAFRQV